MALRRRLLKQLLVEEDKLFYTELNNYNIQITDRGYQDYLETTRTANTGYTNRTQRTAPNTPQTGKIDSMRRRVEELQSAREEKRRQIAEAKIHQHWRENNPDIRALELEQHQKHVVDQWQDQVEDRSQQRLNEEIYNREQDRLMEEARQNALALVICVYFLKQRLIYLFS